MPYTIQHIASILQAEATITQPDVVVEQLVADSRRIVFPATSLFFALHTKRRDGHEFVQEVYNRGCA